MSGYYVGKNVAVSGPLAGVAEDFADVLWERGYSARTVDVQMRMLRDLSRWLGHAGIALAAFDDNLVDSYVAQRRQRTQTLRSSLALAPLLGFLRDQRVVPPPSTVVVTEGPTRILAEFKEYLLRVRGLSDVTVASYCSQVRPLALSVGAESWTSLQQNEFEPSSTTGRLTRNLGRCRFASTPFGHCFDGGGAAN
jgi:site-specific recombinase XerC